MGDASRGLEGFVPATPGCVVFGEGGGLWLWFGQPALTLRLGETGGLSVPGAATEGSALLVSSGGGLLPGDLLRPTINNERHGQLNLDSSFSLDPSELSAIQLLCGQASLFPALGQSAGKARAQPWQKSR